MQLVKARGRISGGNSTFFCSQVNQRRVLPFSNPKSSPCQFKGEQEQSTLHPLLCPGAVPVVQLEQPQPYPQGAFMWCHWPWTGILVSFNWSSSQRPRPHLQECFFYFIWLGNLDREWVCVSTCAGGLSEKSSGLGCISFYFLFFWAGFIYSLCSIVAIPPLAWLRWIKNSYTRADKLTRKTTAANLIKSYSWLGASVLYV